MKVLVDSSFLYSSIVHSGKPMALLRLIVEDHTLVLSDYIIEEVRRNMIKKLGEDHVKEGIEKFGLLIDGCDIKMKWDYYPYIHEAMKLISRKDSPVLACGMLPDIDIILTSDKEFWKIDDQKVKIYSPKNFEILLGIRGK